MTDTLKLPTEQRGRPPAQATLDAEDPRARAAKRAAELREHSGGDMDEGSDKFFVPPEDIPDGWSYEWKAWTVLGAENPGKQVSDARRGWEAVPAYRHPSYMPKDYTGATIDRDGMRLMERPLEITNEVKAYELRKAREQVNQKEAQIKGAPAGANSPFETDNKGKPLNTIRRSYEAIPIPK